MKPATLQRRLKDRLVAAIYGIVEALFPVIQTITNQPTRPWNERIRFESRFSRIIQELLALTARIRPATLSPNPSFPSPPPRAPQTPPAESPDAGTPPPRPSRRRPTQGRRRPLSARQLAQCLFNLLRQLERLVLEAGTFLTPAIRHLAAQARKIAGCHALPTPLQTAHPSRSRR